MAYALRSVVRNPLFSGAVIGLVYGIVARLVAEENDWIPFFGVLSLAFLCAAPLVLGYLTVSRHPKPSWVYRIVAPWLPVAAMLLFCWMVGWEGMICIVMAIPILLVMSSIGGIIGGLPRLRGKRTTIAAALLPLAMAPLEQGLPLEDRVRRLETSISISAPLAAVWSQVVEVPTIRPGELRPALFTRLGFPRPVNATLDRHGVGGRRYARFERGVLFIETITHWENERRLRFTIDPQTDSIPPTTLDRHVTIGGPHFDVLTGEYTLEPLPDGTVLLHLVSELRLSTRLNFYAQPWVDAIMRSIQLDILQVLQARAERIAGGLAANPGEIQSP